jgi:hypothetical protein
MAKRPELVRDLGYFAERQWSDHDINRSEAMNCSIYAQTFETTSEFSLFLKPFRPRLSTYSL